MPSHETEIFPHKCLTPGCENTVMFDDEPRCFKHLPATGSRAMEGYSAKREAKNAKMGLHSHN